MSNGLRRGLGAAALAILAALLALAAAGCGGSDGNESSGDTTSLPTSIGPGEGKLSLDCVGGLHAAGVGEAVREADRMHGHEQVRRLLGRDGDADAPGRRRPVRHGLRLGRRQPATDPGRDVQADEPRSDPRLEATSSRRFKSPPHNTVDGVHYGISLQWGPNTLLYNTEKSRLRRRAGRRSTTRSTRARSRSRTTRSRSRTPRFTSRRRSRASGSRIRTS